MTSPSVMWAQAASSQLAPSSQVRPQRVGCGRHCSSTVSASRASPAGVCTKARWRRAVAAPCPSPRAIASSRSARACSRLPGGLEPATEDLAAGLLLIPRPRRCRGLGAPCGRRRFGAEHDPGPTGSEDDPHAERRVVGGAPDQGGVDVARSVRARSRCSPRSGPRASAFAPSAASANQCVGGRGHVGEPGVLQAFPRQGADAVEQAVADRAVRPELRRGQRAVHEPGHDVKAGSVGTSGVVSTASTAGRGHRR